MNNRNMNLASGLLPVLTGILLLTVSCSTSPELKTEHVVMVNRTGHLIDPRTNLGEPEDGKHLLLKPYPELDDAGANEYFTKLLTALEQAPMRTDGKKKRILLYVHGGLNRAQTSIKRVADYSPRIMEEGTYPIFVNWDSSLTTSYFDHLSYLRQGRRIDDWCCGAWKEKGRGFEFGANAMGYVASVVTTPFYFSFDIARGVIRLPVDIYGVYADLLSSHWRSVFEANTVPTEPWPDSTCNKNARVGMTPRADALLCRARHPSAAHPSYPFIEGLNQRTGWESAWQIARTVITAPVHIGSGLVIDMAGTSSWSAMHRRTTAMFNRDQDLWAHSPDITPTGGIAQFMTKFREFLQLHGGKSEWEVVLVGHSMGTIVANEMIRQFGHPLSQDSHDPLFDDIVFMAAACSLRDYMDTIPHYLEEYKTSRRPTRMYHLLLHDQAESTEQALWGTALPGSLLVWLDGFFTRPDSPLDLVAGRYQNLLRIMHLHDPDLRERISLKVFNFGKKAKETNPQTHGDFGNFPYWKEAFWQANGDAPFSLPRIKED
jgi:pimeloyl-ACP methyl ester carboxylesterase